MSKMLTDADFTQLEQIVQAGEMKTDGELVTVLADHSGGTTQDAILIAAISALCLPAVYFFFAGGNVTQFYSAQMLIFFVILGACQYTPHLQRRLIPQEIKEERVRRHAIEQFHVQGLHLTKNRLGVMVFVSLAERRVEVLADVGFDSRVDPIAWQRVINTVVARLQRDELKEGFVDAINACIDIMSSGAPTTEAHANRLPNRVVSLSSPD